MELDANTMSQGEEMKYENVICDEVKIIQHCDNSEAFVMEVTNDTSQFLAKELEEEKDTTTGPSLESEPESSKESFPSLCDVVLRKLSLMKKDSPKIKFQTDKEIESKFLALSLAFKTDKFTLKERRELQAHQLTSSENDISNETKFLRRSVNQMHQIFATIFREWPDDDLKMKTDELLQEIRNNIDVLSQCISRLSNRCKVYGAVVQEERLSTAFDLVMTYADNIRKLREKEKADFDDTKRLLRISSNPTKHYYHSKSYSLDTQCTDVAGSFDSGTRPKRSISATGLSRILNRVRRASVASVDLTSSGYELNNDLYRRSSTSAGYVSSGGCLANVPLKNADIFPESFEESDDTRARHRRSSMPSSQLSSRIDLSSTAIRHFVGSTPFEPHLPSLEMTNEERSDNESDESSHSGPEMKIEQIDVIQIPIAEDEAKCDDKAAERDSSAYSETKDLVNNHLILTRKIPNSNT